MDAFVVDPRQAASMAADAAAQQDFVQRRQKIDAMRTSLGSTKTEAEELRETCEGFESIFLQKMWEQMRKTVPKEGYLHSKDEEMYQSMFDVELCKKMTSSGGIGLADMLYEQLSQKLADTSRTTSPGAARPPVVAPSSGEYLARKKQEEQEAASREAALASAGPLTADSLYSELPGTAQAETQPVVPQDPVLAALDELRVASTGPRQEPVKEQPKEPAKPLSREEAEALLTASWARTQPISATPRPVNTVMGARRQREHRREAEIARQTDGGITGTRQETQEHAPVQGGTQSGTANPVSLAPRQPEATTETPSGPASPTPVASADQGQNPFTALGPFLPDTASWPLIGNISSAFGWQTNKATGDREWNQGITIDAAPGSRVTAALPGTVAYNGPARGYENLVVLDHGDSFKSYYGNAQAPGVQVGDQIDAGTVFATTKPGNPPGEKEENIAPLFFALKKGEIALNPEAVLPKETFIGYRLL